MSGWRTNLINDIWLARAIVILTIASILVASLIEFQSRRQAVAIAHELLQPGDPAQQARVQAILQRAGATATVLPATPVPLSRTTADQDIEYLPGAFPSEHRISSERGQHPASMAPLGPNEKCVDGVRVRRIPGGWEQVNKDGC